MPNEWLTPETAADDSEAGSGWSNLANSHDGNWSGIYAVGNAAGGFTWSNAIATWTYDASHLMTLVKVKALTTSRNMTVSGLMWWLKAYWDGAWHTVTSGGPTPGQLDWTASPEFQLDGGASHLVEAFRFEFESGGYTMPGPTDEGAYSTFYEIAGWEVAAGNVPAAMNHYRRRRTN